MKYFKDKLASTAFLLITLELFISFQPRSHVKAKEICNTPACAAEATFIKKNINPNADPCDDFYEFACGNFIRSNVIPGDLNKISVYDIIDEKIKNDVLEEIKMGIKPTDLDAVKKLKIHYQNCMNEDAIEKDGIEPYLKFIKDVGGWPVLEGKNWNEEAFDWVELIRKINSLGQRPQFAFGLSVGPDSFDSSKNVIYLQYPPGLVAESILVQDPKKLVAYRSYMVDIAVMLGADKDLAVKELNEYLSFREKNYKAMTPLGETIEVSSDDDMITVKSLSGKFPHLRLKSFLDSMLNPSDVFVNETEPLRVEDIKYVAGLNDLIKDSPKRVIANAIIWQWIFDMVDYMPKRFVERQFLLKKTTEGITKIQDRDSRCMDEISLAFSTAVDALFVRKRFPREIQISAVEMMNNIKNQTRYKLETADWMDADTKKAAVEKLDKMVAIVGCPEEYFDDNRVNAIFSDLEISPGKYIDSIDNIVAYQKKYIFKPLHEGEGNTSWARDAVLKRVNSFYLQRMNRVFIPAGVFQETFFQLDRPKYLNYGAAGGMIGSVLFLGFDTIGNKFDKDGNANNWWKPETEEKFLQKSRCLVDEYSRFTVKEVDLNVNGKETLASNIANGAGIKAAYSAYKEWARSHNVEEPWLPGLEYTPQQLFWISAATNLCEKTREQYLIHTITRGYIAPVQARIDVGWSNVEEFANDFKCHTGTKMNPKKKCNVW